MYKFSNSSNQPGDATLGVILMLVHALAMSAIYIVCKKLTVIMHSSQVTFLYKASVVIAILPWCSRKGGLIHNIRTKRIMLHIVRGLFSALGSICFHYGLRSVSMMDAVAISYMEQVIMIFIGFLYFRESLTVGKLVMIVCGVIGVAFVTKQGISNLQDMGGVSEGYFVIYFALIFWAINNISIKVLGKTEKSKTQVFYASVFGSMFSLPIALFYGWQSFDPSYIKYIVILAMLHFIHSVAFFRALKLADISLVMPFDYSRLIFAGILSYVFLNQVISLTSFIGYALITIGGVYLIVEEAKRKGRKKEATKYLKNHEVLEE